MPGDSVATVTDLVRAAFREAKRLGHKAMGPEHGLLALLNGTDEPARRALKLAGLSVDLVEASFGRGWLQETDSTTVMANPKWHRIIGRTDGLGLAGGTVTTNFVIAMLWDDSSWSRWEAQVPRGGVVAALRAEGVVMPAAPLPTLDRADSFSEKVSVSAEHLERVVGELARRHKEDGGPRIGFNHDGSTGFVVSEPGIDLQAAVDEIIADSE